jgi:hypothetical protein
MIETFLKDSGTSYANGESYYIYTVVNGANKVSAMIVKKIFSPDAGIDEIKFILDQAAGAFSSATIKEQIKEYDKL